MIARGQSIWKFDVWMNSRWRRIFAKVEFVVYVEYFVRVGLSLDSEL
jgi:hypothetical protein